MVYSFTCLNLLNYIDWLFNSIVKAQAVLKKIYRKWRSWVNHWHGEIKVLIVLVKHPEVPKKSKFLVFFLLSYIFSPIDLIPDFIPIFGHWDDFAAIPIFMALINRVTPKTLIDEVRAEVENNPHLSLFKGKGPKIAAVTILVLWVWLSFLMLKWLGVESHLPI
ncbi:MAG: DUF1232 domain-containing protein [Candidatus Heimdallarchaeota archaeon]|nr:DUF1232 domain-containing protein [Candidatus Heimdallarchaeota archaeon]